MISDHVTGLNNKYGLPTDAFDKICQITFDNNSNVDVYEKNGCIVVVGPTYGVSSFLPIETLRHLLWEDVSTNTSIILKQFTINTSSEISSAVAGYFVNKFGRISIVDCMVVGQVVDSERFVWLGHGCAFTGNIY